MNGRKRRNITKTDVLEAYKTLRAQGIDPSGVDIREKTLGGSHTTIYKFLREIRAEETEAEKVGAGLPSQASAALVEPAQIAAPQLESANRFLKSFWESARAQAQAEFSAHEAEFAETLAQMERQLATKQQENDRLVQDLGQMEEAQKETESELKNLRDTLNRVQGELSATKAHLDRQEKDGKAALEAQNTEIQALKGELTSARKSDAEKAAAVGELQTLKEQFALREKEFRERIQSGEAQTAKLRTEATELRERAVKAEAMLAASRPLGKDK